MFIELTDTETKQKSLFNVNHIVNIMPMGEVCSIQTVVHNFRDSWYVFESYEEIMKMIGVIE